MVKRIEPSIDWPFELAMTKVIAFSFVLLLVFGCRSQMPVEGPAVEPAAWINRSQSRLQQLEVLAEALDARLEELGISPREAPSLAPLMTRDRIVGLDEQGLAEIQGVEFLRGRLIRELIDLWWQDGVVFTFELSDARAPTWTSFIRALKMRAEQDASLPPQERIELGIQRSIRLLDSDSAWLAFVFLFQRIGAADGFATDDIFHDYLARRTVLSMSAKSRNMLGLHLEGWYRRNQSSLIWDSALQRFAIPRGISNPFGHLSSVEEVTGFAPQRLQYQPSIDHEDDAFSGNSCRGERGSAKDVKTG